MKALITIGVFSAMMATAVVGPASAQFGGIVHDPLNEIHFLAQVANQVRQINYDIANLKSYSGGWSNIRTRLVDLRQMVARWNAQTSISGSVADVQLQHLDSELSTISQLQQLSDSAQGRMQAMQAQTRLQAELLSQLHEQRQLTLAQIKQDQLEREDALRRFHQLGPSPTTY